MRLAVFGHLSFVLTLWFDWLCYSSPAGRASMKEAYGKSRGTSFSAGDGV